jgi:microsomal dipeptidase-like Zn-dependent dipeptidase
MRREQAEKKKSAKGLVGIVTVYYFLSPKLKATRGALQTIKN